MTPARFFRAAMRRAWHSAVHFAHGIYFIGVLVVSGVSVFAGVLLKEPWLIALPFGAFIVALFVGIFWHAYSLYREQYDEAQRLKEQLATPDFAAQKAATVRAQIDALTRAELAALKHLADCGQLTEQQLVDFCGKNGLDVVTPGTLANRVTFLTRDFALGAWSILPRMEEAVRQVLSESNP